MRCEICDTEIPAGAKECPHCGFEVAWMHNTSESDYLSGEAAPESDYEFHSRRRNTTHSGTNRAQTATTRRKTGNLERPQKRRYGLAVPIIAALVAGVLLSGAGFYIYSRLSTQTDDQITKEDVRESAKKEPEEGGEISENREPQDEFSLTRENLTPYIEGLMRGLDENTNINLSPEDNEKINHVQIKGIEGTISYNQLSGGALQMKWQSNSTVKDQDYSEFEEFLNQYINAGDSFLGEWVDREYNFFVELKYENELLELDWTRPQYSPVEFAARLMTVLADSFKNPLSINVMGAWYSVSILNDYHFTFQFSVTNGIGVSETVYYGNDTLGFDELNDSELDYIDGELSTLGLGGTIKENNIAAMQDGTALDADYIQSFLLANYGRY